MSVHILEHQFQVSTDERPRLRLVPTGRAVEVPRPRMRLTRRGRVVVSLLVAVVLAVLAVLVAGSLASASGEVQQITVEAGQTLSGIAAEYVPELSIREAIVEIQLLNDLSSTAIRAGQVLVIPEL